MSRSAPIGILGGTFDPVHYGHLRLGQQVGETLKLESVRFVPSGTPPHRAEPRLPALERLAMVKLAVRDNPLFGIDERETARNGPAYTFDTLNELRQELGIERPLCLLIGADAFLDFATWHRWRELLDLAHIVVAHRPGYPVERWQERMPLPLAREYAARTLQQPLAVHLAPAGGIAVVAITALDISATMIRECIRAGRSPRYLLPDSVLDYIQSRRLYA